MPSPLARRIDFEIARAVEWRGDALEPMSGSAEAERSVLSTADQARASDIAQTRAESLLGRDGATPGGFAERALNLLIAVATVLACGAGAQLARTLLGDPASGPVNVIWFLLSAIGVPSLFLLLSLVLFAPRLPGIGWLQRLLADTVSLGALLVGATIRLATRRTRRDTARAVNMASVQRRLRALAPIRPLLASASQAAWLAFHLTTVVAAAALLSAEHHTFGWQSTLVDDDETATRIFGVLTSPAIGPIGVASREQVEVSRYLPDEARYASHGSSSEATLALRQAWSTQLLKAVVIWGVFPRAALLLIGLVWYRRVRGRFAPDDDDPYVRAALARTLPQVATAASSGTVAVAPDLSPPPAGQTAHVTPGAALPQPMRETWFAAAYLSAVRGTRPSAALWRRDRSGFRDLPRLDGRAAEASACDAIAAAPPSKGLLLLCDYGVTPDSALARLIGRLRQALGDRGRLLVALTGGETFRSTRLGQRAGGVERRRAVWLAALTGAGLEPDDVVDFDTESATDQSRAKLAHNLGLEASPTARDPRADYALAIERLGAAVDGWRAELSRTSPTDLESVQLQLAARARRLVDETFQADTDAGPTASGAVLVGVAAALRDRVGSSGIGIGSDAIDVAARSLGGMWSVMRRARDVDPRFVVAGLTAGLVAGPLGGALAAGASGLLTGASLASTLAVVGGALGGSLSLVTRRHSDDAPDAVPDGVANDGAKPPGDRCGLPLRTAVIRALTLLHQGRSEPEIAVAIADFAHLPQATCALDEPAAVDAFLAAARHHAGALGVER